MTTDSPEYQAAKESGTEQKGYQPSPPPNDSAKPQGGYQPDTGENPPSNPPNEGTGGKK